MKDPQQRYGGIEEVAVEETVVVADEENMAARGRYQRWPRWWADGKRLQQVQQHQVIQTALWKDRRVPYWKHRTGARPVAVVAFFTC
jgi:hypothetical protein